MAVILDISTSSIDFYTSSYSLPGGSNKALTYHSIKQLYYSAFDTGSGTILETSSFDNYIESSFTSASRFLPTEGVVYSMPRAKVGLNIEPTTYRLGSLDLYMVDDYMEEDYVEAGILIADDGEGNLYDYLTLEHVGNIIYAHGQSIITNPAYVSYFTLTPGQHMSWKSNHPIYTHNYNLKISDYEYNYTLNPTAQKSGSYGEMADNITGSSFQPYITTVGLYNDVNELIAVAKLSQPLPKSANTEMTIQVKLDI